MQKYFTLSLATLALLTLSGCVYDEPRYAQVHVSSGGYVGGSYDDYADEGPYYYSGGQRYYAVNGRYRYYQNRRPVYVERLPAGARYITTSTPYRGPVVQNRYREERAYVETRPAYVQRRIYSEAPHVRSRKTTVVVAPPVVVSSHRGRSPAQVRAHQVVRQEQVRVSSPKASKDKKGKKDKKDDE